MKDTFISLVADGLIREANGLENLGKYTIVFPMHRAGLFLKEELKKRMLEADLQRPVLSPEITTLDGLVSHLTPLVAADDIQSIIELYHIYREQMELAHVAAEKILSLDVFYGWGRQLIQDFDNADMAMIEGGAAALFSNAAAAHELERTVLDEETLLRLQSLFGRERSEDTGDKRKQFEQLWTLLPAIYTAYRNSQKEQGVGSRGSMLCDAVRGLKEGDLLPKTYVEQRTIVFVGFNYLLHAEHELMRQLKTNYHALFFWDYREGFKANSKAYAYLQHHVEEFGNCLPAAENEPSKCKVTAVSAVTTGAQAQYVNNWLEQNYQPGQKTAIVIADEQMLEPVIYALPKSLSGKVNITKGYPLRNTKVYAEVMNCLSDHTLEKEVKSGAKSLGVVLEELTSHIEKRAATARKWAMEHRQEADAAGQTDTSEHADDEAIRETKQAMPWDYSLLMESYYQARTVVARFHSLLCSGALAEIHNLPMLRHLIMQHLAEVQMPFHGEPVTDIQVIGVLETRLLDFDNMLILNAEEGVVPRTPKDSSFIPYYLRKYYGLQTTDEETAVYAYNFFRLFRRCPNPTVVYCNAVADSSQKGMSRFVMQMMISPKEFEVTKKWISEPGIAKLPTLDVVGQKMSYLEYLLNRDEQPNAKKGTWKLSPSAINTYISCPRKFFFEHMCKLRPAEASGAMLQFNEIGSLIHALLQKACEQISHLPEKPTTVSAHLMSAQQIQLFFESNYWKASLEPVPGYSGSTLLDDAYALLNEDYIKYHKSEKGNAQPVAPFYRKEDHPVENCVALANVEKVLKNDQTTASLALVEQEHERYADIKVTADGKEYTLSVGGKIDRLDVMEENGEKYLRVLDYKTGSYKDSEQKADTFAQIYDKKYMLQTLLYCLQCAGSSDISAFVDANGLKIMPNLLFTRMSLSSFDPHLKWESKELVFNKNGSPKMSQGKQVTKTQTHVINDFREIEDDFRKGVVCLLEKLLQERNWDICAEKDCPNHCPFHQLCGRELKPDFGK